MAIQESVTKTVENYKKISLTSDIWNSKAGHHFLSFTAVLLRADDTIKKLLVDYCIMNGNKMQTVLKM